MRRKNRKEVAAIHRQYKIAYPRKSRKNCKMDFWFWWAFQLSVTNFIIMKADAIVDPRAVMVHFEGTFLTDRTVMRPAKCWWLSIMSSNNTGHTCQAWWRGTSRSIWLHSEHFSAWRDSRAARPRWRARLSTPPQTGLTAACPPATDYIHLTLDIEPG